MKVDLRLAREVLEAQLKAATSSNGLSTSIRIHQVADLAEMTQEATERDVAVQILDRESAFVRRLRSALDRIQDGSYGICLQCEEEIAQKRLTAIPSAELCIQCQESADNLTTPTKPETWTEAA
jgi:DnaK suppressor protein